MGPPLVTAVTTPLVGLTVAIAGLADVQATVFVVAPASAAAHTGVNCNDGIVVEPVIVIRVTEAGFIVGAVVTKTGFPLTVTVAVMNFVASAVDVAVMVVVPLVTAVTNPVLAFTVATAELLEDQVTVWVAPAGETVATNVVVQGVPLIVVVPVMATLDTATCFVMTPFVPVIGLASGVATPFVTAIE
jgi:hypothetical protein